MDVDRGESGGLGALSRLSSKLSQFLSELKSVRSRQFLLSLAQLCYSDTSLAYETWVALFPRLWACLSDHQRQVILTSSTPLLNTVCFSFTMSIVRFCKGIKLITVI